MASGHTRVDEPAGGGVAGAVLEHVERVMLPGQGEYVDDLAGHLVAAADLSGEGFEVVRCGDVGDVDLSGGAAEDGVVEGAGSASSRLERDDGRGSSSSTPPREAEA